MKKTVVLLLTTVVLLCGCGHNEESAPGGTLPPMSVINIACEEAPGEEYIPAKVTASWGEGDSAKEICDEPAEIKLRGNSSKEAVKKAYNIKFEEDVDFLGMDPGGKWAMVSNPFDKSMLRPAIGFSYAEAIGIEGTSDIELCQVVLNGKLMGVYMAAEPVESGEGRLEIDAEDGDFLIERNMDRAEDDKAYIESGWGLRFEINEPEEPDKDSYDELESLLDDAEEAIMTSDHRKYKKYIDVDSFVNYYILHELIKDIDFGEYSTRYYFKDGLMYAGPPWDPDLTMGNVSAVKNEEKYAIYFTGSINENPDADDFYRSAEGEWANTGDYYYWLCMDPWFMEKVSERWEEIRSITVNLAEDNELGENLIDRYMNAYGEELEGDFEMYKSELHVSEWQKPADTYAGNVEMLRKWILARIEYLDTIFH